MDNAEIMNYLAKRIAKAMGYEKAKSVQITSMKQNASKDNDEHTIDLRIVIHSPKMRADERTSLLKELLKG